MPTTPTAPAAATDERWWCWECHGLGGWDDDGADRGDFGDTEYIDCQCCNGDGGHDGEEPPACAPREEPF